VTAQLQFIIIIIIIISPPLYSTNRLGFMTEMQFVLCEVEDEFLNTL